MTIDVDDLDDPHRKPDFRRANGAPQIIDADGKNQRHSRPSGWGKELDDENALVNWKLNRAIEGVARDPALQARAVAAKPDDRSVWKELREASINAGRGDQGADIGTAIHAMSERWEDPDDDFHPGDPFETHLQAYTAEMERLGLTSSMIECKLVNMEYRCSGTADRIYRLTRPLITPHGDYLPEGTLVIGDLKTGKTLDFSAPGYAVQTALYAGSKLYDPESDEFLPTPGINQEWGILVHLPADRVECQFQWVDLEVGRWGAYLTQQVRLWRKNWKNKDGFSCPPIPTPLTIEDLVEDAFPGTVAIDMELADQEWVEGNAAWCRMRLDQIKEHPEARKRLALKWPEDLSARQFRAGAVSVDRMLIGMKLISEIEAEFSLSFKEGQPSGTGRDALDPNVPPSRQLPKEATT